MLSKVGTFSYFLNLFYKGENGIGKGKIQENGRLKHES